MGAHDNSQDNYSTIVLTFGKYKGYALTDVPMDYLLWLATSGGRMSPPVKMAATLEARRRMLSEDVIRASQRPKPPAGVTLAAALAVVNAGRRSLARQEHPDRGGDLQAMTAINCSSDWLLAYIREQLGARG